MRYRDALIARHHHQRWAGHACRRGAAIDLCSKRRNGGLLEQRTQIDIALEFFAHATNDARGQQ